MKNRPYSDWFGKGDTKVDVERIISQYGKPTKLFLEKDGYMAALVYADKVVCVGYDGNEYCHEFIMEEEN